ncbi:MAG: arginine--tRNA ligase [Thaumarchaeota archaeon]|nr:MAG: arginine--tRNA ligase [Nitrososphaerota archaeon]
MALRKLMEEAERLLRSAGVEEPRIELSRDPRYGEITSLAAFELAKKLKKPPNDVASEIVDRIKSERMELVKEVEAIRGYINFKADWIRYSEEILKEILEKGERYGSVEIGAGRRIIIEHTSVNPNKPLHVGHARNTCLGDSLARILRFIGYDVIVLNYIDDSGAQMADLILGFTELGYPLDPPREMRFDEYCGDIVYVEVSKKVEEDRKLAERRKKIVEEIECGKGRCYELNKKVVERVLRDQIKTCWRLGATYNILNMESQIISLNIWNEIFDKLKEKKLIYRAESGAKAGCWLLDLSKHPIFSKEGDEVLVRSDGTTTYVARDIAYAAWKLGGTTKDFKYSIWGVNPDGGKIYITDEAGDIELKIREVDRVINVIDVRQKRPQEIVKYALKLLGLRSEKYIHYAYEVVALSGKDAERLGYSVEQGEKVVHMSGRKGLYIKVEEMLNMLKDRALEEVKKRHEDWSMERMMDVAEKIAVGALRYALIKPDIDKLIVLDTDEILRLEGDTGPYLQYSYARACRILEKSEDDPSVKPPVEPLEAEKKLLRMMAILPKMLLEFDENLLIKPIANYAYRLASNFNDFYEKVPVLRAPKDVRRFRLGIVSAFKITLANVLRLLGIPLMEEM